MEHLEDILERMNRSVMEADQLRAAFNDWFNAASPQPSACPTHPSVMLEPDFQLSWERSQACGRNEVAFAVCGSCAAEEEERARSAVLERVVGVPPNISHARFDSYHPETHDEEANLLICHEWADDPQGFLLLHGNTGTGKTHLITAMLAVVVASAQLQCRYREHVQMVRQLREGYDNRALRDRFERLTGSQLLCWDEFGFGASGTDVPDMMHNALNHREKASLPTVIAFNGTVAQFKQAVGDRMESRIRGNLYCEPLLFNGRDRRSDRKPIRERK